jgi:hypothetical protein
MPVDAWPLLYPPLVGRVGPEAAGVGVHVKNRGQRSRHHIDPHPDRLRFASAIDPPHKGEGIRGLVFAEHRRLGDV